MQTVSAKIGLTSSLFELPLCPHNQQLEENGSKVENFQKETC
jgi:hypothetical protein